MGLSNSTPVYGCVPSELFIQFANIFSNYGILMIDFRDFFKKYPSKIKTKNSDIPLVNLEMSNIKNISNDTYKYFYYNICECIYKYYYKYISNPNDKKNTLIMI